MVDKINIAVFVSGGGTNLQALIDFERKGFLKSGKLALVLSSNKSAFALERAFKNGIKTAVVERKTHADQNEFESEIIKTLEQNDIQLIVLAGFMSILSADFTKKYDKRIINVHPSLIPSFCGKGFYGLKVHEEALKRGVKVTGATVHYVNEIADGGEIIMQKPVCIKPNDTKESLQLRVMQQAEWKILPKATESVAKKILNKKGNK